MAVDVTPDAQRVAKAVCGLLAEHLRAVCKYGPDYARRYVEAAMTGTKTPMAHDLHPDLAHLIRDLVQDELCFERRSGYSNEHRRAA